MNESDANSLRDALILINRIRLEYQAKQLESGQEPTNFVPPDDLSPLMRRNLKAAFMLVNIFYVCSRSSHVSALPDHHLTKTIADPKKTHVHPTKTCGNCCASIPRASLATYICF